MTKPEMLRFAQYLKDEADKLPCMGSVSGMAASKVLEGVSNALRNLANAPDNLPES